MFDKIAVKDTPTPQWDGPTEISPVYKFLKSYLPGEIPWNCASVVPGGPGRPFRSRHRRPPARELVRHAPEPGETNRSSAAALSRSLSPPHRHQVHR